MTAVMFAYKKNRFLTSTIVGRHGCDHECIYTILDWYSNQPNEKRVVIQSELMSV